MWALVTKISSTLTYKGSIEYNKERLLIFN
jgi:hypothetical protein